MKKYVLSLLFIFSFMEVNYIEYISISNIIVFISVLFGFITASYTILLFLPITKRMYLRRCGGSNQLNKFFSIFRMFFTIQLVSLMYFVLIENHDDLFFYICVCFSVKLQHVIIRNNFILIAILLANIIIFYRIINFLENMCIAIIKNKT